MLKRLRQYTVSGFRSSTKQRCCGNVDNRDAKRQAIGLRNREVARSLDAATTMAKRSFRTVTTLAAALCDLMRTSIHARADDMLITVGVEVKDAGLV